jgi:hypothetical protein
MFDMGSVLIPASGSAVRMRGLPKFLLPSGVDELSLLELHIRNIKDSVDEILIGINPIFYEIAKNAKLKLFGAQLIPVETMTMTETVLQLASVSKCSRFTVIMPDTVFESNESYNFNVLSGDLGLSLWRIRDDQYGKLGQVLISPDGKVLDCVDKNPECRYKYFWGAMTFNAKFLGCLDSKNPHLGIGILSALAAKLDVTGVPLPGRYWDCGTPIEYMRYLKTLEI